MSRTRSAVIALSVVASARVAAGASSTSCGSYVGGRRRELLDEATQVVLMREGTRT